MIWIVLLVLVGVGIIGGLVYYNTLDNSKIQTMAQKFAGKDIETTDEVIDRHREAKDDLTNKIDSNSKIRDQLADEEKKINAELGIEEPKEEK